jgi:hypothetical protein
MFGNGRINGSFLGEGIPCTDVIFNFSSLKAGRRIYASVFANMMMPLVSLSKR